MLLRENVDYRTFQRSLCGRVTQAVYGYSRRVNLLEGHEPFPRPPIRDSHFMLGLVLSYFSIDLPSFLPHLDFSSDTRVLE